MRYTGGIVFVVVCVLLGCSSSRKAVRTESRGVVETVTAQEESKAESEQTSAMSEAETSSHVQSLDSGRVTIERDSVGLPVAINWRRSITDTATKVESDNRHEQRNAEAQSSSVSQSVTDTNKSEQVKETTRKPIWPSPSIRAVTIVLCLILFCLWLSKRL